MIQNPEGGNKRRVRDRLAWVWHKTVATSRRRPYLFWGGTVAVTLTLLTVVFAWSTLSRVSSVEDDISEILATVRGQDVRGLTSPEAYAGLIASIGAIEDNLEALRQRTVFLRAVAWVPVVGSRIGDATKMLELGSHFARGTRLTLEGYSAIIPVLGMPASGLGSVPVDVAELGRSLESAAPLFFLAQEELASARAVRSQLGSPASLGGRIASALDELDRFTPFVDLAILVALDTPRLAGQVLDLRTRVSALRQLLSEPAAFLDRPQELELVFRDLQERADEVQAGLQLIRSAVEVEGGDAGAVQAVDTAIQLSVLLSNLGEALGRLAALSQRVFDLGPLTPEAAALMGTELPAIKALMEAAQQDLAELNSLLEPGTDGGSLLTLVSTALGTPTTPLQKEESLLATGVKSVDFLTDFLGYDGQRRYLLIGQNDDEIRATGGFIGVVVEMTLDGGELTGLRYLDSTKVDAPPYDTSPVPPQPIYLYLWMGKLLFRDGNWNPHFPAAAAQLADLYERAQGIRVDGVIAATEEVILDLVDVFDEVRVPELTVVLDRDLAERYVEDELPYPCRPRHNADEGKRCFDEDLFQVIIARLLGPMASDTRSGVVDVLVSRLAKRDLLLHVFDPQAAELLWERDWNGAVRQVGVGHDYLMIIDSSLPGHARSVVERRVQYQVRLRVGQPVEAELLIEYRHKGDTPDPNCRQALPTREGCYWNYLRVYIPVAAQEIRVPPIPLHEGSEALIWGYELADSLTIVSSPGGGLAGLTEIGAYIPAEPQTSVTLPISYQLPASTIREIGGGVRQYRLLVQKQPGTPVEPVSLFVRLPEGATLVRTSPPPTAQANGWVRLDVDLAGDVTFTVDFRTE